MQIVFLEPMILKQESTFKDFLESQQFKKSWKVLKKACKDVKNQTDLDTYINDVLRLKFYEVESILSQFIEEHVDKDDKEHSAIETKYALMSFLYMVSYDSSPLVYNSSSKLFKSLNEERIEIIANFDIITLYLDV